MAAPGLFGGLFLSQFEKTEGGGFMNPLHSPDGIRKERILGKV